MGTNKREIESCCRERRASSAAAFSAAGIAAVQVKIIKLLRGQPGKGFKLALKMCLIRVSQVTDIIRDILARCSNHFLQRRAETDNPAVMLWAVAHVTEKKAVNMALRIA